MSVNMFSKPIAANPMSQFQALPLQFMAQALQTKQNSYDKAAAMMEKSSDDLLKTSALSGDTARHQEIIQGYEQKLSDMAENAGGDLSMIKGDLDLLKRQMKEDMSYGELGAINKAHQAGVAEKTNLDKLYQTGKIQRSGYDLGLRNIGSHVTTKGEMGYNSFSAYRPSNITDPLQVLNDSVDEINAKYDSQGQKFISEDVIKQNLTATMTSNPDLINAMRENFTANYTGKEPEKDFSRYLDNHITSVIQNKQYAEKLNASKGGSDSMRGRSWGKVNIPNAKGFTSFTGGDIPVIRDIISRTGLESTQEFDKYVNSAEGKAEIAYMNRNTNKKFPKHGSHSAKVAWIEENALKPISGEVISMDVDDATVKNLVSRNGTLLTRGAVMDESGALIENPNEVLGNAAQGENPTTVVGLSGPNSALPYGTIILVGKDGRTYYQENTDTELLGSKEYASSILNSVKYSNTGTKNVTLSRTVYDPETAKPIIASGSYQTKFNPDNNHIGVYQNGDLKYIIDPRGNVKSKTE